MNLRALLLTTAWILAGCVFLATLGVIEAREHALFHDEALSWAEAIESIAWEWWHWLFVAPLAAYLALRFPFERGALGRAFLAHLPGSVAYFALYWIEISVLEELRAPFDPKGVGFIELNRGVITYAIFVGAVQAWLGSRRRIEREQQAERLAAELTKAELQVLRSQLHPHFLFNTLNAISALMHRDVDAAERMLEELSELLRRAFAETRTAEGTLRTDLEFVDRYLSILQVRYGGRLVVERELDADTLDARVPSLILQPLVENAVAHGIDRRQTGGTVTLRSALQNGHLVLEVEDDGPGLPEGQAEPEFGVGLSNTRDRLARLYGDRASIGFRRAESGGLRVRVTVPFPSDAGP